jgi:hypothetical protein
MATTGHGLTLLLLGPPRHRTHPPFGQYSQRSEHSTFVCVRARDDGPSADLANPMIVLVVVLVLVAGALAAAEILLPGPRVSSTAGPAMSTAAASPTAVPTSAPTSAGQDPVAMEACRRLAANDDANDVPLMIDIGSTAAQSMDDSIRADGNLLRNIAQIAANNKVRGATTQQQTKDRGALITAAADLLDACYRSVLALT